MNWFVAIGVFLCVCTIAAAIIAREAVRTSRQPEPPVVVLDEAYTYIADRLSPEVAATLTPDDLRGLLDDAMSVLAAHGADVSPGTEAPTSATQEWVLDGEGLTSELLHRAGSRGEPMISEQVVPVVELLFAYFRLVGAAGEPAAELTPPQN